MSHCPRLLSRWGSVCAGWGMAGLLRGSCCSSLLLARTERYRHVDSEDEETNDEESSVEIGQFSSCSHRFSKVSEVARGARRREGLVQWFSAFLDSRPSWENAGSLFSFICDYRAIIK